MANKPLDETKMIKAGDLVKASEEIRYFLQPVILITDISSGFSDFIAAANLLIEDGWRIEPMAQPGYMMALCYNPRYKNKHVPIDLQRE